MAERKGNMYNIKTGWWLLFVLILGSGRAGAHSLPDCKAQLTIHAEQVLMQFKTPLEILELASKMHIDLRSGQSVDSLKQYLLSHISVSDSLQSNWSITVGNIYTQQTNDVRVGDYQEIVAEIYLVPTNVNSLRNFTFHCDLVIHQIPNQSIIFSIEQDWQNGVTKDDGRQIGVIAVDIPTGKIWPLKVKLEEGNWFKGFKAMFALGMQHIKEGTDHLLFIITLLLPACLLAEDKKWSGYAGLKYSIVKLLKIVTAFTIGHSIALLIGVWGWIYIPQQFIEVMIAVSILVSAAHAVRPVFYHKEIFIAFGFGFIHGLAFSQTLQELNLSNVDLALSVLGFNAGIEVMQLYIIALIIPWFIMLSQTTQFIYFKNTFACLVGLASVGWIVQRITGADNFISTRVDKVFLFSPWLMAALALLAAVLYTLQKMSKKYI
ncbi:MAG TPA: HupE/UreJ family protein [Ohtaekwangia sp.]|uniref:HupE/UreJ family protein n=1 Tax=Ohtaekwangia sp. TaxID=2066019 RepID=UPI002F93FE2C